MSSKEVEVTKHEIYILVGTALYGISVVLSRAAMEAGMGPYTFNMLQHIVASLFLICLRNPMKRILRTDEEENDDSTPYVDLIRKYFSPAISSLPFFEVMVLGTACSLPNFIGSTLNQVGLVTVEAGKSAFLTSMYVVFTPAIQYAWDPSNTTLSGYTWLAAGISLLGSFFLSGCSEVSIADAISYGEIVTIIGAVFWAIGILMIDYSLGRANCVDLTCVQMLVSSVLCTAAALSMEPSGIPHIYQSLSMDHLATLADYGWLFIILTGATEAVAFLLDTVGQMGTSGSRAALLMGMDSLVAVAVAYLMLGEVLTYAELFGCILLLLSTVIATIFGGEDDAENDEEGDEETYISDEGSVGSEYHRKKYRIKNTAEFTSELRKHRAIILNRRSIRMRRKRAHSVVSFPSVMPIAPVDAVTKSNSYHGESNIQLMAMSGHIGIVDNGADESDPLLLPLDFTGTPSSYGTL